MTQFMLKLFLNLPTAEHDITPPPLPPSPRKDNRKVQNVSQIDYSEYITLFLKY